MKSAQKVAGEGQIEAAQEEFGRISDPPLFPRNWRGGARELPRVRQYGQLTNQSLSYG